MPDATPVARSAVVPAPPVAVVEGWEVSARRSTAALRLADASPLAKVVVRAEPSGVLARALGVAPWRAAREPDGPLVVGAAPGEWWVLARPGFAAEAIAILARVAAGAPAALVDVTHGRTLLRLTGDRAPDLLAKVCGVDLHDRVTPNGAAFRSSVAKVVTDVIRDDVRGTGDGRAAPAPERSYLLHCERAVGQYLFDALLDAGAELGVAVDGFRPEGG
ncbi:MAG TPA: sarcosine oxidase subunit gamma family protein [Candidatus Binatia bacterium]|nr:sarcosine oxidase subunit gamma family protein [Candidatus Binatia bacterium]